nr:copia protein [Tanacetum cinerariifolium]
MTLETHNWSSSAHQELHKIVKDEIFPIVNQVDARVQNFEIQFLKEAAKFVGDFKSLAKEADESLAKQKALELEIKRLLRAVVSQDIMSVVQKTSGVDTSNLQTELEHTKERCENCIIKKENEYAKLWNDWYKKCDECKYEKISYDKTYKDMQQKIEWLQAQLGDLKGKSKDTSCVSDTLNPLSQKLETQLFNKVSDQKDKERGTSANTKFAKQSIVENLPKVGETHALSKPVTSNSDPTPQESKVVKNDKVIAPGMFSINPFKTSREAKHVPNNVRASARTKPITVLQHPVIPKKDVNSDSNAYNDMQQKIERLQAQLGNLKGKCKDTSCVSDTLNPLSQKLENKNVELEFQVSEQKDIKRGTSANTKFAKQPISGNPPKVGETHALSKPITSNLTPTPQESKVMKNDKVIGPGMFRINPFKPSMEEKHVPNNVRASVKTKPITVSQPPVITKKVVISNSNGLSSTGVDNTKTRRPHPRSNIKNDRVPSASKISRSKNKEVEVEQHHRKLLLSRNKKHMSSECNNVKLASQNVKTKVVCAMCKQCLKSVNHDVCLLNYVNVMNSYGKNQKANVSINEHQKKQKPKVKKTKKVRSIERLASPKPSKPRSFLRVYFVEGLGHNLFSVGKFCDLDLERITILLQSPVIIIRTDNGIKFKNQVLKEYFDSIGISHQLSSVRTPRQNRVVELRNRRLVEAARTMLIFSRAPLFLCAEAIATACFTQNRSIIHRRFNKTPYELINDRKSDIFFLYVFGALCYPKNDREDIGKLGAKGDIGFLIGYSADSCAYRVFNRRTKKIMETMNDVDEFNSLQQHAQQQGNQPPIQLEAVADNVPNAMFDANMFVNPFATPSTSAAESASSQYVDPSNMHTMKAIRIFLAYDARKSFIVFQMDVKTAFLHGTLKKDVYVCQPEVFIDAGHPSHVYKLKKTLYGLKHVPRAWYDELSTFLLLNHFFKGTTDSTLFIRHFVDDILVVHVYVDDIIFGTTYPRYTQLFSDLMKSRFEMSMIGEMTFFLGLQVNQSLCGIFINQSIYVLEIFKKYGMKSCDPVGTLMEIKDKLDLDQNGTPVNATKYRSMIGALMYLTSSRPDIVHATCLCAQYQAKPTEKHLKEVKRIFYYLRGTVNMGLWYTKDSSFEVTRFSDANYAGCKDTFKSTSGRAQFLGEKLVSWSSKKQDCMVLS